MASRRTDEMCERQATWLLVDGAGPDDYTHACDEHRDALISATHVGMWPLGDTAARCCHLGDAAPADARE
jgi:hypothetical protein